jgi:hypothetical protein
MKKIMLHIHDPYPFSVNHFFNGPLYNIMTKITHKPMYWKNFLDTILHHIHRDHP